MVNQIMNQTHKSRKRFFSYITAIAIDRINMEILHVINKTKITVIIQMNSQ